MRDWLFVDDHARALTRAFEAGRAGETYVISGRSEQTNIAVGQWIWAPSDQGLRMRWW